MEKEKNMRASVNTGNIIQFKAILAERQKRHGRMEKGKAEKNTRIVAITSGKGGVGKTNIVANLGFALGKSGKRVLILDADLGLGNLDVLLGITPQFNLSHVISGEKKIGDILVEGPGKVTILPASSGVQELTQLTHDQRFKVISELERLLDGFDILLIDTAAGISTNVLYFSISAQEIMVVVTPEPTSITDAYALMKILSVKYAEKNFKLLVNAAASTEEADEVFRQLNLVANRFLDISIEYFGHILMDDNIKRGVRKQKVVMEMAPMAKASRTFAFLANKLWDSDPPETGLRAKFAFSRDILQRKVD
jgi:flagellar biosynthesis protein FlhG